MQVNNLFLNPVASDMLNLDLDILKKFCYNLKNNDEKGREVSNIGGWQSHGIPDTAPELQPLIKEIEIRVNAYFNEFDIESDYHIEPIWFNINGFKDWNMPHEHPKSILGGIFYVQTPEDCGDLVFNHPVTTHQHYLRPHQFKLYNELTSNTWNYASKENGFILFPAWMPHWVEPNLSKEDRISIAFNIVLAED